MWDIGMPFHGHDEEMINKEVVISIILYVQMIPTRL